MGFQRYSIEASTAFLMRRAIASQSSFKLNVTYSSAQGADIKVRIIIII